MKHSFITFCRCFTAVAVLLTAHVGLFAQDIALDEERAIQAAAAHVAPSVVRVETISEVITHERARRNIDEA